MTQAIDNLRNHSLQKRLNLIPSRRVSADNPFRAKSTSHRVPRRRSCSNLKKSVTFSEHSNIRFTDHRGDGLFKEQWYSSNELLRFKIDRRLDVQSFRRQAQEKSEVMHVAAALCPVGIEQFLSVKATENSKDQVRLVVRKVLLEQTRQQALGFRDPHQLAYVAEQISTDSLKGAQKRGKFQEMSRFV